MMYLNIAISLCLVLATLTTSVLPKPMSDSWPQDVNEPFSGDVDCKDRSCIWNKLVMMGLAKSTTYR